MTTALTRNPQTHETLTKHGYKLAHKEGHLHTYRHPHGHEVEVDGIDSWFHRPAIGFGGNEGGGHESLDKHLGQFHKVNRNQLQFAEQPPQLSPEAAEAIVKGIVTKYPHG